MPETKQPRRWTPAGYIPFRLEVLTPVYIGCGDTVSSLEYVVRQEGDAWAVHLADVGAWLCEEANNKEVQTVLDTGDVQRIRRMFQERLDVDIFGLCRSRITDPRLGEELRANMLQGPAHRSVAPGNRGKTLELDAHIRNPVNKSLYLPGSSLKGAMSTSLIDWLDVMRAKTGRDTLKERMHKAGKDRFAQSRAYNEAMVEMFGSITEHAMQALKVADITIPASHCQVSRAVERGLNPQKQATPKNPCECVPPGLGAYYGSLMLDLRSGKPGIDLGATAGCVLGFEELRAKGNAYFWKRFQSDMQKFYALPHFAETDRHMRPLHEKVETALQQPNPPFLLRVGHYSHVECVTVSNNQPQTRMVNGVSLPSGTTRTLADGVLPFGWVLLHCCSMEEFTQGRDRMEAQVAQEHAETRQQLQQRQNERLERQKQVAQAQAAREEAQRQAVAVAAQQKAEEEAREAVLAQLSPEERAIAALSLPTATEDVAKKLLDSMGAWPPELQYKAAEALKNYWEHLGKWQGKNLTPKQQTKVQKVRAILGL